MNISVQFDSLEEMAAFAAFINNRNAAPSQPVTVPPAEAKPAPKPAAPAPARAPAEDIVAYVTPAPSVGMRFVVPDPIVHIENNTAAVAAPAPAEPVKVEPEPAKAERPKDFVLPATEPEGEKKKRGRPKKLADTGPSERPAITEIPPGHAQVISGGAGKPTVSRMVPIEFDEDEGSAPGTESDDEAVRTPPPKVQFSIAPTIEEAEREVEEGLAALSSDIPERKILTKNFKMDPQIYETPKIGVAMEDAIAYLKQQGATIDDVTTFILENASKFKSFPKSNPGENTIRKFVQGKF